MKNLDLVELLATCQPELVQTLRMLEEVFQFSDAPILLTGAVGCGKRTVARRFGKVTGTFTEVDGYALEGMSWDAWRREIVSARGGVLFLNGLEMLETAQQVCLLRTLESEPTVRLVASMNETAGPMGTVNGMIGGTAENKGRNEGTSKSVGVHAGLWAWVSSWTFEFPQFAQRVDDWPIMLDQAVREWEIREREARRSKKKLEFQESARQKYLRFAVSPEAAWTGNGYDLRASVTRLATLAEIRQKLE
ncbi:MAG: hypothetical protein Q4C70_10190, partial [Planctomycetia bacterium]|nr:hypothetical protein [Planctomycetia bacterium]